MTRFILQALRGRTPIRPQDALLGGLGAILGIAGAGLLARLIVDGDLSASPLLVAPIGASAVLVFAVPASPLAQPRPVIVGNMLSALVGVICALAVPLPLAAAALAVGLAIALMILTGCLHPPGGAMALTVALMAGAGESAGLGFVLVPAGLCSVLLVVCAYAYGRISGRAYPHRVAIPTMPHGVVDAPPERRLGYQEDDLQHALSEYGQLLDVDPADLDVLFRQVEERTHRRLHAEIPCRDIMTRDVISLQVGQSARSALAYLQSHDLRTAPVIDEAGRLVGLARRAELLAAGGRPVGEVVDPFVHKVTPETPIQNLMPLLASGRAHEAMVVDTERRLIGVITQTDLLSTLYRAHVVEAVVAARAP